MHVRDFFSKKKHSFQKAQLSFWSEHVQDACVQFFLRSEEVCGGGLEDYSSEAQGASHRTLQWLVYSIIISVKLYGKPEVGIVERFVFVILQR